jgi:hypothetical protein
MAESSRAIGHETNHADEDQKALVACLTIGFSDQLSTIMGSDQDRLGRVIRLLRDELEAGGQRAVRAAKGIGYGFDWAAETRGELPEELRSIGQELLRYLVETTDHAFFRAAVGVAGRMAKRMPTEVAMCLITVANDASKPARNRVGALDALGRSAELLAAGLPGIARLVQDPNDLVNQKALHLLDLADGVAKAANEWFGGADDLDGNPKADQNALFELDILMRWGAEVWTIMSAGTGIRELRQALGELDPDLRAAAIPVREKRKERLSALRKRKMGVPDPLAFANIFRKDGDDWSVRYDGGKLFPVRDLVGVFYVGYLIEHQGEEFSPSQLSDVYGAQKVDPTSRSAQGAERQADKPVDDEPQPRRTRSLGVRNDGGESPDDDAMADYHKRLTEIKIELEKASKNRDEAQISRLQEERHFLLDEIAKHMKPDGQPRQQPRDLKKTRDRVKKAIEEAMEKISMKDTALGLHLQNSLKLDTLFSYKPERAVPWNS